MPFEKDKFTLETSVPSPELPEQKEELGYIDVIKDAFHIDNPIVALFKGKDKKLESTDFDVVSRMKDDSIPVDMMDQFLYVDNEREYQDVIKSINKDMESRERLANAGLSGILASMTAATASPSTFLTGGVLINALKAGKSIYKTAAITSAVAGGSVLGEEKLLQATQAGRSDEEVLINSSVAAILAGLLSGLGVGIKNGKLKKQSAQLKGKMIADTEIGKLPNTLGEWTDFNDSVGAARATLTKRELGMKKSNSRLAQPFLDAYVGLNKLFNPAVRMMTSESRAARQFLIDTADVSFKPQAVAEGKTIPESLEGALKRRYSNFAKEVRSFEETFAQYKREGGRLKWQDFRNEVGRAFHSDKPHPNPQVARAVDQFHKYYEDIAQELIDTKLMPEDILTAREGSRYLNRVWNRDKIKKNINRFKADIEPYMRRQLSKIKNRLEIQAKETKPIEEPIFFHGTTKQFETFDLKKIKETKARPKLGAIFFSDKRATPEIIAGKEGRVIEATLNVKNPMKVKEGVIGDPRQEVKVIKEAKKKGHDAIVGQSREGEFIVGVFSGKQIKTDITKPTKEALDAREQMRKYFDDDVFEDYLKESVTSIANNLTKVQDVIGFSPPKAGAKGPLKARSFNIPDEEILDWLDNDILFLSDTYTRQVIPEIEIKARFGDRKLEDIAKEITDEYDALIERASPKAAEKLQTERRKVLRDIDTTWNLLRGTYKGFGGPADARIKRAANALMTHNYMVALGGVAVSSIPDVAMGALRRGFENFFGKSLKPFVKDFSKTLGEMSRQEARSYGQALEYVASLRSQSLYSIGDPMAFGGTPFERFVNVAGNKMSNVNLINQWNDMWQTVNTLGIRFRIVNNILDQAKGKKITTKEEEWLNFVGLGQAERSRILDQIQKHGIEDANGDIIPNIDTWDDRFARQAFKSAIGKETDRTVITKGVTDIPRFGNTLLGKMIFQWQNFNFAFNNKVIISAMQDADGQVLAGLSTLMVMGMMTEALKAKMSGRPLPETNAQWIDAGLDRSGMLGLLAYGNSYAELAGLSYKQLLGKEAPAPFGSSALDTIFGPSGRTFRQSTALTQSLVKAASGEGFTKSDLHRLRSMTWGQNVIYLKHLFDMAEKELGEDLPEKRKPKRR